MNKLVLLRFSLLYSILFSSQSLFGQGCSDAGFCTMGAMKPNQPFSRKVNLKLRSVELSHYLGVNAVGDVITSYTADASIGITPKFTMQVKVPYMLVFGLLGNTNGLGDLSLSATKNLIAKEKYQLNLSVGAKIPTNNSNLKSEAGLPLPGYNQTSLGTYDGIAGISFKTKRWLVAAGYQMPFNANKNEFFWGPWNKTEDSATARLYPVSRNLKRGNDAMLRLERNFRLARFNTHLGLLGIYRLSEDSLDTAIKGKLTRVSQAGTKGLVVSAIAGIGYNLSAHSGIKLTFGLRLYSGRYSDKDILGDTKHLSLDGLTRIFVNTIGYEFRF